MGKKNSLIKNASVLMIASIISRVIGLIYRRPLGEVLGPVGLGYYGYASNLYSILLLISSYSIPMAVSKIVSERLALRQYKNAGKVFRGALIYAAIVGGATALVAFFAGPVPAAGKSAERGSRPAGAGPHHLSVSHSGSIPGIFSGSSEHDAHLRVPDPGTDYERHRQHCRGSAPDQQLRSTGRRSGLRSGGRHSGHGSGVVTGLAFMLLVYFMNRNVLRRRMGRDRNREAESYGSVFRTIFFLVTPIILPPLSTTPAPTWTAISFQHPGFHGFSGDQISAAYGEFSNYYLPVINIPWLWLPPALRL